MNLEIKPLTPELAADFFDFFDNRAFTDHAEWSCCYCTYFHIDSEREKVINNMVKEGKDFRTILRNAAAEFINDGTLQGYLVYDGDITVGFVNVNDKTAYRRFDGNRTRSTYVSESSCGRDKAVTCFTIAPEYRGQGIATTVLERICNDAGQDGYSAVEGYPRTYPEHFEFPYNGPERLFEKVGFVRVDERSGADFNEEQGVVIMRLALK
ncbi:MAG: GNAT family N-acetyltransferase [Bacillota bacterium]|nr:GNAT family N-acetyltransferase [Bacillota bacterium]